MKRKLGIIGAGRMGKVFAHHLSLDARLAVVETIADKNADKAAGVANLYGIPSSCDDYRDIIGRADIDAVIVAAPTSVHVEIIVAAARAGKHIFCEKPLALSVAECRRALEAVQAAGVKLQIGYMRRYDHAYAAAKQKIDAGVIGKPVLFKSTSRDPRRTDLNYAKRSNSGGLILDMGVHDFDLAQWLMGDRVVRAHSEGECLVFPELAGVGDIDNATVNLKFAGGGVGCIDLSRNAVYGYDIRTEVLGAEGSLQIGYLQQTQVLTLVRDGVVHDTVPYFMERFGDAYAAEIRDFVACVTEARQPESDGPNALCVTAIGQAATLSLDEQRPVEVAEVLAGPA